VLRALLTMLVFTIIFGRVARLPSDGTASYSLTVFACIYCPSYRAVARWLLGYADRASDGLDELELVTSCREICLCLNLSVAATSSNGVAAFLAECSSES